LSLSRPFSVISTSVVIEYVCILFLSIYKRRKGGQINAHPLGIANLKIKQILE
jgi:hypothetical protein